MSSYSAGKVRSGLLHFAVGKVGSGLAGVAIVLLLVRALRTSDYATLVALTATFEIAYLVLNFGVLPATWRFLPEERSAGNSRNVFRIAVGSTILRAIPLALFSVCLVALPSLTGRLLPVQSAAFEGILLKFAAYLLFEGVCRHIDLVFELLLLQRVSQSLIFVRACARIAALAWLSAGFSDHVQVDTWMLAEASISAAGCLAGCVAMFICLAKDPIGATAPTALPPTSRILKFALPAYLSQVLGAFQGFEACKLLISHVASPAIAAGFGFTINLVTTLQRYLPSYLLAGFVRPLFVHAGRTANDELGGMASLLLKTNLVVILPVAAVVAIVGESLLNWLSGGRAAGQNFALLLALLAVMLQMAHMVIGLLALAVEDSQSGLLGTSVGLISFAAGLLYSGGTDSDWVLAMVIVAELSWCGIVLRAVKRRGAGLSLQFIDVLKLVGAVGVSLATGWVFVGALGIPENHSWIGAAVVVAGVFFGAIFVLKPLNPAERRIVAKLIPRKYIFL